MPTPVALRVRRRAGVLTACILVVTPVACSRTTAHREVGALPLGPLIPAPTGYRSYRVPDSISSDCSRDASGELNRFIATIPARSVVLFPVGGCYAQGMPIVIDDRSDVTIDGRGSTFEKTSPSVRGESTLDARPNWRIAGGRDVVLQNVVVKGVYRSVPNSPNQFDSGVLIWGTQRVALRNLSISSVDGDLVTVSPDLRSGAPLALADPARGVIVDGLRGLHAARQGIALTASIGALVTRSVIEDVQNAIDLEPDVPGEPLRDIQIVGNRFGALVYTAVAAIPGTSPGVGNVTVERNQMTRPPEHCYPAMAFGGDSPAPSPSLKAGYFIRSNRLMTRGDGLLVNGVTGGSVIDNTVTRVGARASCAANGPPVPIRLVGSTGISLAANVDLGYK